MAELEEIIKTLEELIESLESNGAYKEKQVAFTDAIVKAWEIYSKGKIETKVNAMPKVMYMYATQELPKEIENGDISKLVRELKQFRNTMKYVVEPSYK